MHFIQYYAHLEKKIAPPQSESSTGLVLASSWILCPSTSTASNYIPDPQGASFQGRQISVTGECRNGEETRSLALPLLYADGEWSGRSVWRMQALLDLLPRPDLCSSTSSSSPTETRSRWLWQSLGRNSLELWRRMARGKATATDAESEEAQSKSSSAQSEAAHTESSSAHSAASARGLGRQRKGTFQGPRAKKVMDLFRLPRNG